MSSTETSQGGSRSVEIDPPDPENNHFSELNLLRKKLAIKDAQMLEKDLLIDQLKEHQLTLKTDLCQNKGKKRRLDSLVAESEKDMQIKKLTEENSSLKKRLGVPSGKKSNQATLSQFSSTENKFPGPQKEPGSNSETLKLIHELSIKVENLSNQLEELKKHLTPSGWKQEVASMKKEVKTAIESAKKAVTTVDTSAVKERMEAAWTEVVNKKSPGILPMITILREQLEQQKS